MSTKTGLFAKLFGKKDTAPASDCCDVQIIEEDEIPPQQPADAHGGSNS
ncbi:hypothetical protein [Streptomyces sp. AP-93]|nr:hypothetical protein [Streptomyces sp. AP-93]MCJ0871174.1 hypothetical protein [Streptomyces sp. AP-93]